MTDFDLGIDGLADLQQTLGDVEDRLDADASWVVGSRVEYAIFLEFGTSKMDPKPFFRPAIVAAQQSPDAVIRAAGKDPATIDSVNGYVKALAFGLERRVKQIITAKGLIDTGTLRASITAVPLANIGQLPTQEEAAEMASADVEVGA